MRTLLRSVILAMTSINLVSCGQRVLGSLPDWIPPDGASANPLAGRWYSYCFPWIVAVYRGRPRVGTPWDIFGEHSLIQIRQVGPTSFLFEYFPGSPGEQDDWERPGHRWLAEGSENQVDLVVPQPSSNLARPHVMTLVSGSARLDPRGLVARWNVRYVDARVGYDTDEEVEFTCRATRDDQR